MKIGIITSILIAFLFINPEQRTISGKISDSDNLPLIGASIHVKGTTLGTITDYDGTFKLDLPINTKKIIISYTGFETQEIELTSKEYYKVELTHSSVLEECVVVGLASKKKMKRSTAAKSKIRVPKEKKAFFKSSITKEAAPLTTYSMDMVSSSKAIKSEALPTSGQITAGEWNDLNNWEDWKSLVKEKEFNNMQDYWKIFPEERYAVFATNEIDLPLVNATVTLHSKDGSELWQARTDNAGKAELWNGFSGDAQNPGKITISKDGNTFTIDKPKVAEEGTNHLKANLDCLVNEDVDIMFVVDATGSMGDEINFLRSELADVIERVETADSKVKYRTGAVFYKDVSDDYLTQEINLNGDIDKTIDFIKNNNAGGGGDFPEAVESGLEKALSQDWNENALARIIFLLLDAPPHHNPQVLKKINDQIKEAAKRGIKIIPITASGIDRETEFLMKFISISTNSTYVFITDDSGIGNGHLAPVVDDYDVEKLNDLLVRLITHFSHNENCNSKSDPISKIDLKIYPNPASKFLTVEADQDIDRIVLRSSSGKIIISLDEPNKGRNEIRLDNLVGGMYTISILKNNKILETKSVIMIGA